MDSVDLQVWRTVLEWKREGHEVDLVTVIETWGSSPRPPGALLVIRKDGQLVGSVSGGCIEDDLVARVRSQEQRSGKPQLLTYGVTKEEAQIVDFFKQQGLQVVTPDVDAFRKQVQGAYATSEMAKSWPAGIVDRINAAR